MSDDIDNYIPYLEEAASKATVILELGVAKGTGSTLAFTRGMNRSKGYNMRHVSVDHEDYMEMKPTRDIWTLVTGDSRAISTFKAVKVIIGNRSPCIIFIDTHQTHCQVQAELELWSELADDHTVWLFHDTYMMGKYNPMVDTIKEFAEKNDLVYEDVSTEPHGLGRMYKP